MQLIKQQMLGAMHVENYNEIKVLNPIKNHLKNKTGEYLTNKEKRVWKKLYHLKTPCSHMRQVSNLFQVYIG